VTKPADSNIHPKKRIRCAIYTRKSSEEGLDQDFNSLEAQREACEAFIKSQKHEGWELVRAAYDDGGFSGGTLERPGLKRLLDDIKVGKVEVIVVYKVDRLTRSLADFAKIVEVLDAHGASFVSITQQFNTTTSMGRLTLNVLLSFAQFEREVTGERIRDKIAASKKKGMWMGGLPPLGYDVHERKLVINEREAAAVRKIYQHYLALGSVRRLKEQLDADGVLSKARPKASHPWRGGKPLGRGALYRILQNRLYLGEVVHRAQNYPGEHKPIVDTAQWDKVQLKLKDSAIERRAGKGTAHPSLLAGLLHDDTGQLMTPTHAVKRGMRYRYYVSRSLVTGPRESTPRGRRIPASDIETLVTNRIRAWLASPAALVKAITSGRKDITSQKRLIDQAGKLSGQWPELAPHDRGPSC
jgi:DNA invertase Pin-like site-specific DNA recombinase